MKPLEGVEKAAELLEGGGPWSVEVNGCQARSPEVSALLALANGYLGLRGEIGLRLGGDESATTLLAGFHESWPIIHAENAYGLARVGQTLQSLPDATGLEVFAGGQRVCFEEGSLLSSKRDLDMSRGILTDSLVWEGKNGVRLQVSQRVAVSISVPGVAAVDLSVTALGTKTPLRVASIIEESSAQSGEVAKDAGMSDPRGPAALAGHLNVISRSGEGEAGTIVFRTETSKMMAALSYAHKVSLEGPDGQPLRGITESEEHDGTALRVHYDAVVAPGETLRLSKWLSYARSDVVASLEEPPEQPEGPLLSAELSESINSLVLSSQEALEEQKTSGIDGFFTRQERVFASLWKRHDVELVGDPLAQKALRWTVFQLIQSSRLLRGTSVSVKGLSGTGYDGHYFWDTEIYLLPFLTFTAPSSARAALGYRHQLLDAARQRAATMSQKGALFPWRTISGEEASAYYPAGTAQYHINADIAYAVDQYMRVTGDADFLVVEGLEILVETARLWADLGFWDEPEQGASPQFHIFGVTGPDEYTAVVNDNFYTNVMARENLRNVLFWASWMDRTHHGDYVALRKKLGLSDRELLEFRRIERGMHIPFDRELGVHAQDNSFLQKPRWDFDSVPRENYPLLLNYHPLVIYRHQVIKQADVVLALYLSGDEFPLQQRRADFEYYDPLTTGDSSLSAASQSIVAADVGYTELARDYFDRALYVDLADLHGNADLGLHLASLGGAWSAAVMGFGGVRLVRGRLKIDPNLPPSWELLKFKVCFEGRWVSVAATRSSVQVTVDAEGADAMPVVIGDRPFSLLPGTTVTVASSPEDLSVEDTEEEMGRFADLEPLDLPPGAED